VKYVVGVADMKLARDPGDVIVTHALGSCLGIAVHDPVTRIGGMLHVMMPLSNVNPEKAKVNPFMFVDTGVPLFFRSLFEAGVVKGRMIVKVAGGASIQEGKTDTFGIGKRNYTVLKKMFWKNGVLIEAEEVGGSCPRTMYLDVDTGRVTLNTAGKERQL
jgi:chemotaxis protein CheD